ncbi:MAG: hypothetical protein JW910_18455 [Anaerolineae bacterium]|nr:hypothetical protein [Anaerolineae bacterium]
MDVKQTLGQASALQQQGKIDESLVLLRSLVRQEPNLRAAWWGIAVMSRSLREKHQAVDEVLRLAPGFEKARALKDSLPPLPAAPVSEPVPAVDEPPADPAPDVAEIGGRLHALYRQYQAEAGQAQGDVPPSVEAETPTEPAPVVAEAVPAASAAPPPNQPATQPITQSPRPTAPASTTATPIVPTTPRPSVFSIIAALVIAGGALPVAAVAYDQLIAQGDALAQVLGLVNVIATLVQLFMAVGVLRRVPGAVQNAGNFLKGTAGFSVAAILFLRMFLNSGDELGIDVVQASLTYWIWLIADAIGLVTLMVLRGNLDEFEADSVARRQNKALAEQEGITPFPGFIIGSKNVVPYRDEHLLDRFTAGYYFTVAGKALALDLFFTDRRIIIWHMASWRPVTSDEFKAELAEWIEAYHLGVYPWTPDGANVPTDLIHVIDTGCLIVPYAALLRAEKTEPKPGYIKLVGRAPGGREIGLAYFYHLESQKRGQTDERVEQQHLDMLESLRRGEPVAVPDVYTRTVTGYTLVRS